MALIKAKVSHAHAHPPEEAVRRMEILLHEIRVRFPAYGVSTAWIDEKKTRTTITFSKEGRGKGSGLAELHAGRVEVTIEAEYALPFLVPVFAAETVLRTEIGKALKEAFG